MYELLVDKYELYEKLEKGVESIKKGETYSAKEVFEEIDKTLEE